MQVAVAHVAVGHGPDAVQCPLQRPVGGDHERPDGLDRRLEHSSRRSLLLFERDPAGFSSRPISGTLLVLFLVVALFPGIRAALPRRGADTAEKSKEPA